MSTFSHFFNIFKQSKIFVPFTLLAMCIFALTINILFFNSQSIRLDEAQSLFQTDRSLSGLYKTVAKDIHVPLYHTIIHFTQIFWGNDIQVVRLVSLVFFLGTILAIYALGSYAINRSIGLFAALLTTISPFMNWYGNEARMYTLLTLLVTLNSLFFLKIYRSGKPSSWILYVLTGILGIYTHYFFALIFLTQILFYIAAKKQFAGRYTLAKFIASAVVIGASIAPWLLYVRSLGNASDTKPAIIAPSSQDLFNAYSQFLFGFQVDKINTIIISLWPVLILFGFFALQKNKRLPTETKLFLMYALVPALVAFFVSILIRPIFLSRYLIVSLPGLLLFISYSVLNYPTKISIALRSILVTVMLAGLYIQTVNINTPVKEDYKGISQYLSQHATASDVIVISSPFTVYPIDYYYTGPSSVQTLPVWNRFDNSTIPSYNKDKLTDQVKIVSGSYQTAWVVLSYDQGYEKDIKSYFDNHFQIMYSKEYSPKLNLYQYKLRYDPGLATRN